MVESPSKVCVVGMWHLGVVTSVCLADLGYHLVGVDKDRTRVDALNRGRPPLYEPGLEELLAANLASGRLRYTTDLEEALRGASYIFLALDTPVDENDEVDLAPLYETARELVRGMEPGATLVITSQVPVGTCESLAETVRQAAPSLPFGVACVPENLRLGQAIERFKRPDVLVFGADSPETLAKVEQLLAPIAAPRVRADLRTAEMSKHAINAYLATTITFANEIANLCDAVGADAVKVLQVLQTDSRVSPRAPLRPGLGFGGGTLARDMKVLHHLGQDKGYQPALIDSVLKVNARQNSAVALKLKRFYSSLRGLTVGVLGLTYKAGTSTLRRSPALDIIRTFTAEGATVRAYDPKAAPEETASFSQLFTLCADPYAAAAGSHALVLVTDWPEFKELDFPRIRSSMQRPVLLDAQNMLDADTMGQMGFLYQGVGRGRRAQEGS